MFKLLLKFVGESRIPERQRFEVILANTDALRKRAYELRHKVYCEDLGWEPTRPNGLEQDAYDAHSHHLLIRVRDSSEYVACARIILAAPDDPDLPLPFESTCQDQLGASNNVPPTARHRIGEVSRLAVVAKYRRRKGEAANPTPVWRRSLAKMARHGEARRRFPYLLVSLYLGVVAVAHREGLETLFLLTEPRLARHFDRLGVAIRQIGPAVEHRGLRIPCMMRVDEIVQGLNRFTAPIYRQILHDIEHRAALTT